MRHPTARTFLILSLIAVGGCSTPAPPPTPEQTPNIATEAPVGQPADPVDAVLQRAAASAPAERAEFLLEAAGLLVARNDFAGALAALDDPRDWRGSADLAARRAVLLSAALVGTGNAKAALAALDASAGSPETPLSRGVEIALREARADVLRVLDRPLESASERAALQPWLSDDTERAANAGRIVAALATVPLAEIEQAAAQAGSDEWRGLLEFSVVSRDMRRTPEAQRRALEEWVQRHGAMPSLATGAGPLASEIRAAIAEPARVALLLPLSGRAAAGGQAVLQGYLAAHYAALSAGEPVPSLAIVDTAGSPEAFAAAYRKTAQDGAEVVIGPLLKEELAAFTSGLTASVPTLALNFLDTPSAPIPGVRQFGVDPADEVAELGKDSRRRGFSRAIILADASPRASRLVEAFSRDWRDSGGDLIDTLYLGDLNDYRASLERSLLLDRSHERSTALGRITGLELQTEPRRRMDVDLVVLLAEPEGARSIRALLPFLYAGDITVRSTSMSYAAGAGQAGDLDLEKLQLLDMPWFSGAEEPLRNVASVRRGPQERLIALGVDARRLQSRLRLLDHMPTVYLGGATGELVEGANGRLHRRTSWYVIDGGQAKPALPRLPIPETVPPEGAQAWMPTEDTGPEASETGPKSAH